MELILGPVTSEQNLLKWKINIEKTICYMWGRPSEEGQVIGNS